MPHQNPTQDPALEASHGDQGQAMAEYALLLSGVALLAIVAVFSIGPRIAEVFGATTNWFLKLG